MKTSASATILGLLLAVSAAAQTAPSSPPLAATASLPVAPTPVADAVQTGLSDPQAPTHHGLRYADFVSVNELLTQVALEDPAIVEFSKEVEAMIARRQEMIIAAACLKYPAMAERIQTMKRNITELKQRAREQAEQIKVLRSGQPAQPVPPRS